MKFSNEIKAGAVVLAAFAILAVFFVKTANFQARPYEIKTYFRYAGDLKNDAIVKLSGIEVGRVKALKFIYDPETKVECILSLARDAKVRRDSIAYIGTAGFVGDAYVGLTPGKAPDFLRSGEVVTGEDPVQMRELMKRADNIAEGLDKTMEEIKLVVTENRAEIDGIVLNLEATTQNFKEFSEDVRKHPWKLLFKGE